jgi:hypothetical protein
MASDMTVALARSTLDRHTYFGHNSNRPRGEGAWVVHMPGRAFSPGEVVRLPFAMVPQVRRTWTVLAGRAGRDWGYQHGVNEKGVAVGCTPIRTRLEAEVLGLGGPDLVRLTLERASSACQAVEILTDLIGRHGQGSFGGVGSDYAFLIADAQEASLIEAAGRHWALAEIGSVRAVTGLCLLRQDWDRISRGLVDVVHQHGWWPEDGCKFDFAGTLGQFSPDHARDLRRWGQATVRLEQHAGHLDTAILRGLLRDLAEMLSPLEGPSAEVETAASMLARLGPARDDLPLCWYALSSPAGSVFFPLFLCAELPTAFVEESGHGCPLWRMIANWQSETRRDPRRRIALRSGLADLQQRLDEHLHECYPEANDLHHQGRTDELARLTGSFMQHCYDRFEEMVSTLRPDARSVPIEEELVEVW